MWRGSSQQSQPEAQINILRVVQREIEAGRLGNPFTPVSTTSSINSLESRRRRTKGSVVGEEWCQNAAPLR